MFSQQSFGYWLRLKRKSLDLTRDALAERVGCSAATIRKIEAEERRPSEQIAKRLAEIFEIPTDEWQGFQKYARGNWNATLREQKALLPWQQAVPEQHTNLPAIPTSLVGRKKEISELRRSLLRELTRLVTLVGSPGIGKTRLSMETARSLLSDFPDGVFFIALAPIGQGSLVASTIVQTLGFIGKKEHQALDVLKAGIQDRQMLLVLDNCEHVIEEVAHLAAELLSSCSRLKILATSRESLRIQGEHLYPVHALEIPKDTSSISVQTAEQYPALTLFAERARAVRPDFVLNEENVQGIASICAQLDGLPLAIELIASRMRMMSPQSLLERMSGQFVLSADGMRAVIARQKTLNNAIGWSYDFLSSEEQRFFAFISVFSGGFTLDAAEAVFSELFSGRTVTELVTSLFDKSLLQRTINEHGEFRFSMLFTIHEYGLKHLRDSNMEDHIRDRHLEYFLGLAEKAEAEIHGAQQVEWLNRVEEDTDNFRSSLGWSVSQRRTEVALRLLSALGWPWEMRCYYREAQDWLEKIKTLPDINKYPVTYSKILNHLGRQLWTQESFDKAYELLNESLSLASSAGDEAKHCRAAALNWIGLMLMFNLKEFDRARAYLETGLDIHTELNDPHGVAVSTFHLGILESELEHFEDALHLLEKSLERFRQFGDLFFISRVSIYLGYLFQKQEQYDESLFYFEQQLRLDMELQFWDGIANGWYHIGAVYHQKGELERAEAYYEQCRVISREHGLTKTVPTIK